MVKKNTGQIMPRFAIYIMGLLVLALGIVLQIKAGLGASPWDVLHVGLYYQFGLTIGSWSIIVGMFILTSAALLMKEFPSFGAFLNMILVGFFIDLYMLIPFLSTPDSLFGKTVMLITGILVNGYGMGIYISAQFGAGPRDSLMLALTAKTGWKVSRVRAVMELIVLLIGWQLGGPVYWGTILFSITIGYIASFSLPQCKSIANKWLQQMKKQVIINEERNSKRGVGI
jgi:uncharacterized protein